MATDFFERQSTARRQTKWLVFVFALAVIGIVGTTVAVAALAVNYGRQYHCTTGLNGPSRTEPYPWQIPVWAGVGSLVLIGGGTMFKIAQLAGGGTTIAERLGGRRVYPNTNDPTERKLLNVVEEMALASGVPVPPVFLLTNEKGINAFAAGFSPSDAVIGVTRGCAEQLTRDQLQGVIAHEFSHILNGDMRLNLRLIGTLHGILLLGLVGRELLYIAGRSGRGSSKRGGGLIYLLVVALAIMILGFLGTFIGNLIKAAVSRQREFLADASAVQFTRNPQGIAGALKRIGAAVFGSKLVSPCAAEASHMYFSQGVKMGLSGLLATHPPLDERIRRLDPQWDGKYPPPLPSDVAAEAADVTSAAAAGLVGATRPTVDRAALADAVEEAAEQVARPTQVHRQYVAELVAAMPRPIVDAARDPYGARAVTYALLLDRDSQIRQRQLQTLKRNADPNVFRLTQQLIPLVDELDPRARLPLVDLAMPALRALSPGQYETFRGCFVALVRADERLSLFEWVLHQMLLRHLEPQFEPKRRPQIRYYGLQRLAAPTSVLISTLARASQGEDQDAFVAGARHIPEVPVRLLPADACGLKELDQALQQLTQVAPKHQRRLVEACAAAIRADGQIDVEEAELLRAVCDVLDCPLPPLLAGQPVAAAAT